MKIRLLTIPLLFCSLLTSHSVMAQGKVETIKKAQLASDNDARGSQKKIDKIDDQTTDMTYKYRQVLKKIENTKAYNAQLGKLITEQAQEKIDMADKIESLKNTNKGIVPLMLKMVETLDQFVELDMPCLPQERTKRTADLNAMMNKADISTSEKFRRVLEGYQVENEYGRTIEA